MPRNRDRKRSVKKSVLSVINDGLHHHITFSKKDKWAEDHIEVDLDVYLDGVKITDDDHR